MLVVSIVAVIGTLFAYIANHLFPFSQPISLLWHGPQPYSYHVVLVCFSLVLMIFLFRCIRAQLIQDAIVSSAILGIMIILLFIPNGEPGHNTLAVTTMVLTGVLSLGIAQRDDNGISFLLATIAFLATTLLYTQNLTVMGIVEGVILCIGLILINLADLRPVNQQSRHPFKRRSHPVNAWWKPGMGAGLLWGTTCIFISGLSGIFFYDNSIISGPFIAITCAWAGYVAWRQDHNFWLRMGLVMGTYILVVMGLGFFGILHLRFELMIPIFILLFIVFASCFLVALHID